MQDFGLHQSLIHFIGEKKYKPSDVISYELHTDPNDRDLTHIW